MSWSLLDGIGRRKYLTHVELGRFLTAAGEADPATRSLCLTIALTGARISEVLALTADRIDQDGGVIVFETLKRRRKGVFRAVPIPEELIALLHRQGEKETRSLWTISRPTAWKRVKAIMHNAAIPPHLATPRALRHTFGVEATAKRIALSLIARWLGHSRIETTAIYATPVGDEERALAALMWQNISDDCFLRNDAGRPEKELAMVDFVSKEKRSAIMRGVKSKNTRPELRVRSHLHKLGLRFRVHRKDLPGCPDICLPKYRTVIFVHGCFWHQHSGCKEGRIPSSNNHYWQKKFDSNLDRDSANAAALAQANWRVIVVWECETRDETTLTRSLQKLLIDINRKTTANRSQAT